MASSFFSRLAKWDWMVRMSSTISQMGIGGRFLFPVLPGTAERASGWTVFFAAVSACVGWLRARAGLAGRHSAASGGQTRARRSYSCPDALVGFDGSKRSVVTGWLGRDRRGSTVAAGLAFKPRAVVIMNCATGALPLLVR